MLFLPRQVSFRPEFSRFKWTKILQLTTDLILSHYVSALKSMNSVVEFERVGLIWCNVGLNWKLISHHNFIWIWLCLNLDFWFLASILNHSLAKKFVFYENISDDNRLMQKSTKVKVQMQLTNSSNFCPLLTTKWFSVVNKIEGTPILKLAMVQTWKIHWKIHRKVTSKNSSKNNVKNNFKKQRQKTWKIHRNVTSKNTVENNVEKTSKNNIKKTSKNNVKKQRQLTTSKNKVKKQRQKTEPKNPSTNNVKKQRQKTT